MRRSVPCLAVLVFCSWLAACDNGPDLTPPTPPTPVTETFTGSLSLNGANTHSFATTAAGTVTATITAIDPSDDNTTVGFRLGTWTASTSVCQANFDNTAAVRSSVLTGTTSTPASLCVQMYDAASKLTNTVTYTVTVVHN
jgi:hypothetical protein